MADRWSIEIFSGDKLPAGGRYGTDVSGTDVPGTEPVSRDIAAFDCFGG